MAHRIGRREPVGRGLWRVVGEDLAGARRDLGGNGPAEERIHGARQRLKRIRTLLRAAKPAQPGAIAAAGKALAGAAHLLAESRDADVAAASAHDLREIAAPDGGLDRAVAELDRQAGAAHRRAAPLRLAAVRLAAAEAALGPLPRDLDGEALVEAALERAYRRGRRAMAQARASLATPDLHGWRKAVKAYWRLIRVCRKRLPGPIRQSLADLERLGDLLGRDHDQAVLAERLAEAAAFDPDLLGHLSLIARERRRLEADAFRLGDRLYRRKTRKQVRRLRIH